MHRRSQHPFLACVFGSSDRAERAPQEGPSRGRSSVFAFALLQSLLAALPRQVLVAAGRESIDRSTPDDPKRWLRYHDENIIHVISLEHFTQDETRTYLAKRGITDPTQVLRASHQASLRIPPRNKIYL